MVRYFRSHLAWKMFFSYLIVIVIGAIVLITVSEFAMPRAFDRHLAAMSTAMMESMNHDISDIDLTQDLFNNFRAAMTESLTIAGLASITIAIVVSVFISQQVIAPIKAMMKASRYIANGHYDKRVYVSDNIDEGELDELAKLAVSFNQMTATIEETEKMRQRLIADVAHELRTPLTTIKGSMEGLIDGVLPPEPEIFQQVYQEAERLQHIVNDLQELSRIEAGAYKLNIQPVPIQVLVSDVVARLRGQFKEKSVMLSTEIPPAQTYVLADRDRVAQVFINLVGNALQYTQAGGAVTIRAEVQSDHVRFTVQDTGVGISPEHLSMLFTRFYRVDKSRSRASGGNGIGLTIAKHLIDAHGGIIWVESEGIGKGSTFFFTLPLANNSADLE